MRRPIAIILCVMTPMVAPVRPDAQQQPATQQPAAPPPSPAAQKPPQAPASALVFPSGAGIILSPIKPDETAVFEEVMGKVKEALMKSDDPVRKQQAVGWTVYKAAEPFQNSTLYVTVIDPAMKGADYNVFELLQDSLGEKTARELFEKFRNAHAAGHSVLNLTAVPSKTAK